MREGLWRPSGAGGADLAMQVARPADLQRGRATVGADGQLAVAAVERLRENHLKKLPATGLSGVTVQGGDSGGGR